MVEARPAPGRVDRLVTRLARGREARVDVVGVARGLVAALVAAEAIHAGVDELAVPVAVVAPQHLVGQVERVACPRGVVPLHRGPRGGAVALFALGPEPRLVRVVLAADPVTVHAPVGRADRHALPVAARARNGEVPAVERKGSGLVESPRDGRPAFRLVAGLAGWPEGPAVRVVLGVTGGAGGAEPDVSDSGGVAAREVALLRLVAGAAGERGVRPHEETGEAGGAMRVGRQLEALGGVARLAPRPQLRHVHVGMAGRAVPGRTAKDDGRPLGSLRTGRPRLKDRDRRRCCGRRGRRNRRERGPLRLVAGRAGGRPVPPAERECRLRVRELAGGETAVLDAVAAVAGGRELPAVHVRVAGRARRAERLEAPRPNRSLRGARRAHRRAGGPCRVEDDGRPGRAAVTAGAVGGAVLPAEEPAEGRGVLVAAHREAVGAVTRLACPARLALVHVLVARRAGARRAGEQHRALGARACGLWLRAARGRRRGDARAGGRRRALVTALARQPGVPAGERELRLARVVEGRLPEAGLAVAGPAVLRELTAVHVRVAPRAPVGLEADGGGRLHVAAGARHPGVLPLQRKRRLGVVDPRVFHVSLPWHEAQAAPKRPPGGASCGSRRRRRTSGR